MNQTAFDFDEVRPSPADAEHKRQCVLYALKQGPVTTFDMERLVHRGQAVIRELRLRGYEITTRRINNKMSYELVGFSETVQVSAGMKNGYYSTAHWREKRIERLRFDEFRCCHCRSRNALHVHHWHYDLFNESLEDLTTLCGTCHKRIHENTQVRVHFPLFVKPEIAARLQTGSSMQTIWPGGE